MTHEPTPGPWRRCGGVTPRYMAIVDASNRYIVFQMADSVMEQMQFEPIETPDMEEQAANARLIAAAPDLLEALRGFLNACDAAGKDDDISLNDTITAEIEEAARAAIAKATTGEPS